MNQWRPITICAVLAALIGISVWGLCGLTQHAIIAFDSITAAAQQSSALVAENRKQVHEGIGSVLAETRDVTIALLDKGRPGKPETMGLIPAVRQVVRDTGSAVQTMQQQVAQTQPLIVNAATGIKDVSGEAVTLLRTSNTAVGALNDPQTGLRPLLGHADALVVASTGTVTDINATLQSKAVKDAAADFARTMKFTADMSESGAGIMADARRVSDKETADFMKPVKWYMQPIKKAGDIIDIGAAVARHTP